MRRTRAEIDLQALKNNFDGITRRVGPNVEIMGIVKANAYGHGIIETARALVGFGCNYLGVGFLEEGIELRSNNIVTPILVLGGVLGSQISEFLQHDLDITVSSLSIAEQVNAAARRNGGKKARVHLKVDTGMERIGVRAEHAVPFAEQVCRYDRLDVIGMYSHFATSDERDKSFAHLQLQRFNDVLTKIKKLGIEIPHIHMANSGAILDLPDSYFTMVRPGIMLYGCYPSEHMKDRLKLEPVMSVKTRIMHLKRMDKGRPISYGRTYYTQRPSLIATIPMGYADGLNRHLSNRGQLLIGGKRCPIVGTVCMDLTMVDVTELDEVKFGDEAVIIGRQGNEEITADEVAELLGTISYEVLCGISARVRREYI